MISQRRAGTRTISAIGAATVAAGATAAVLLILAFRAIGEAAFNADETAGYVLGGGLLAVAFGLEAAAIALGGVAGALATLRLRRLVLATALNLDPDSSPVISAGDALGIGLDLDLIGGFLVTNAPTLVLGVGETAAGLVALAFSPNAMILVAIGGAATLVVTALGWPLSRHRAHWGRERGAITSRLVERLIGQRTVTIQDDADHTGAEGIARATRYHVASLRLDRTQTAIAAIPLTTLTVLVAIICLGPSHSAADNATGLGGALLFAAGLGMTASGIPDAAAARDARRNLRLLDRFTLNRSNRGEPLFAKVTHTSPESESTAPLLAAHGVTATLPGGGGLATPVDLSIEDGDAVLLTGASGSGKTTLGEILSGRRPADTGLLELRSGLSVARVPQAGDDHIFHASLLFNVLCGRTWPPTQTDTDAAGKILAELGLGLLVKRMPAGLGQPLGDGGWRLSSGERARISLARALVTAPDILILDETTAAVDARTRDMMLAVSRKHSRAVVVIAHP